MQKFEIHLPGHPAVEQCVFTAVARAIQIECKDRVYRILSLLVHVCKWHSFTMSAVHCEHVQPLKHLPVDMSVISYLSKHTSVTLFTVISQLLQKS